MATTGVKNRLADYFRQHPTATPAVAAKEMDAALNVASRVRNEMSAELERLARGTNGDAHLPLMPAIVTGHVVSQIEIAPGLSLLICTANIQLTPETRDRFARLLEIALG